MSLPLYDHGYTHSLMGVKEEIGHAKLEKQQVDVAFLL
jgi:hypothetical protein